jgi:hypothetical protein
MADPISPFVQQAIREKAQRDLAALELRVAAFDGLDRAQKALVELANTLAQASPAIAQTAADPAIASKMKKLRKVVDDARGLADEISTALDVSAQREATGAARSAIVDALVAAGIDPKALTAGGEAE